MVYRLEDVGNLAASTSKLTRARREAHTFAEEHDYFGKLPSSLVRPKAVVKDGQNKPPSSTEPGCSIHKLLPTLARGVYGLYQMIRTLPFTFLEPMSRAPSSLLDVSMLSS
ncbi:hypothetical protein KCU73_g102, partial [Aureobasidium melanogenum]